jgi:amicyanin
MKTFKILSFTRYPHITQLMLLATMQAAAFAGTSFLQHNLVSDVPGLADQTDPNLVNPWGMASSATGPWWISNNHSGSTTVYNGSGQPFPAASPLIVRIPASTGGNPPSTPTGEVFNSTSAFVLSGGQPATFLFASEDGTISGWNTPAGASAVIVVDNSASGAVYKGLALGSNASGPLLYAANFSAGTIDVLDGNFSQVNLQGSFTDPDLPPGFAPFNIQNIGNKLYVAYARQDSDKRDDVSGQGNGFIDVFDFDGVLIKRLVSNGNLNSPWGLAVAPAQFGDFSNALLVGNFGDGTINAYDSASGASLGQFQDSSGAVISIPGLWALRFGNGGNGGDASTLYFTAGIAGSDNIEDHGLFGSLQVANATSNPAASAVQIDQLRFAPVTLDIAVGTPVLWTNKENLPHDVTADDNQYFSNTLDTNQTYSHTYTAPGTYTYHCSIHPFMKAKVVVH